jgi:hypothetical protein
MLFVLGIGAALGRLNQGVIFALMVVIILLSYFKLPYTADLLCGNFLKKCPGFLGVLEPSFSIPGSVLMVWIFLINSFYLFELCGGVPTWIPFREKYL